MQKLLLVGGDLATPDAINYCKEIGVYTIMTNHIPYENNPYKQMADEAWEIPVEELDILEDKCRESGVTAVFAGVNEHNLDMTKALAKRLGLPFYASDLAWNCSRNKNLFKKYCLEAGLDVPKCYTLDDALKPEDVQRISYPVIMKPTDGCGSAGITVCYGEEELQNAYQKAFNASAIGEVVVEDYIDGVYVFFMYSLIDQKPIIHGSDANYPIKLNNKNMMCLGTPDTKYWADFEAKYSSNIETLFDRIGIKHGCVTLQAIYKNGHYYIYEMGYRLDGAGTWRDYKLMHGSSQLEMLVDFQLGREDRDWRMAGGTGSSKAAFSGYFVYCNPGKIAKITGMDALKKMNEVRIAANRYKEGDMVKACDSMFDAAFILMIAARNLTERMKLVKKVNETIHFYDENGEDMIIYYDNYDIINDDLKS